MINYPDALEIIFQNLALLKKKLVRLQQADGYHLAEDIQSDTDLPLFDNSAMDGYAVISKDTIGATMKTPVQLRLIGSVPAGRPFPGELKTGQALYIATGGVLPRGADAVIPIEKSRNNPPDAVEIFTSAARHDHIRFKGGEVKKGDTVLTEHSYLGPAQLGLLAALGRFRVKVYKKPGIAFLATGDELIEPTKKPGVGQVRNSNAIMVGKMVEKLGFKFQDLGIVSDRAEAQIRKFKDLKLPDVLLTSAGVSVGRFDIIADTLKTLGLEVMLWKVAIKPGKPVVFGKIGKTLYFGLPGNPVSAAVVYRLFVEPALLAISGSSQPFPMIFEAISESNFKATSGRLHFARGICFYKNGWRVKSTGQQGSHILSGMASANCLVLIPPDENVKSGEVIRALMLDGIRVGYKTAIKAFSELLP